MNFIETLKSIGGVKPCPNCGGTHRAFMNDPPGFRCDDCKEDGTILDLSPLLAKPLLIKDFVGYLLHTLYQIDGETVLKKWYALDTRDNLYIVGPQRASNLVYEVARQLGGTAAVTRETYDMDKITRQEFSLPIPNNATILFVTDIVDMKHEKELMGIAKAVNKLEEVLPYCLCLIHRKHKEGPMIQAITSDDKITGSKFLDVISLHQENL